MTGGLLVVMLHYVRPKDPARWGGIVPLCPEEFEEQLDFLSGVGRIVPPSEALSEAAGPRIVLTFDDGTADHHDIVFPILRRRGLSGLFAVLSGPALEGYVPTMHLLHVILSRLGEERVWDLLRREFPDEALGDRQEADRLYGREATEVRRRVKYALNFALPRKAARDFLVPVFGREVEDTRRFVREWYLDEERIHAMRAGGMEFAVHGHRHRTYEGPPERFHAEELAPCEAWLTRILGARSTQYVPAFGGASAAGRPIAECEAMLRGKGYRAVYLTEPGTNPAPTFFLRRVDCADLPPRKAFGASRVPFS